LAEPFFQGLIERLESAEPSDRRALVDLQRDIGELSLTSGAISRTRKVDVMPDRPIRKSQSVRVAMNPEEVAVYHSVAMRFIDRMLTSSWGSTFAMLQALRLTASCIPAAVEYFARRDRGRGFGADMEGAPDDMTPSAAEEHSATPIQPFRIPSVDSKFELFLKVLKEHASDQFGNRRKTVVFAFFKPTLRYLSKRLSEHGIEHRLIHGDVSIPDRELLIDEFVRDSQIRVLLSSEVGSEGVDLQVASTVVNYDLPWNPMVVEQRIGRLDRIGQRSQVISIVNLVLKNTVEERVLLRLYERIDLFERTIGEIEDILGNQLEELALQYLRQ
jgi:SNF2 family DNA or RNA helicase